MRRALFLGILAFPPDKGAAKWHRPKSKLLLGIDHTAIVVADTDQGLAFYRDRLGLRVAGDGHVIGGDRKCRPARNSNRNAARARPHLRGG